MHLIVALRNCICYVMHCANMFQAFGVMHAPGAALTLRSPEGSNIGCDSRTLLSTGLLPFVAQWTCKISKMKVGINKKGVCVLKLWKTLKMPPHLRAATLAAMAAHCWAQASCRATKGRCASSTLRCTEACSSPNLFTHGTGFMLVVLLTDSFWLLVSLVCQHGYGPPAHVKVIAPLTG